MDEYNNLLIEIERLSGVKISNYSESFIKRRLLARMRRLKQEKYNDYLKYIIQNHNEVKNLFSDFSIHVTHFFRDKSMYDTFMLESLFNLLKKKDDLHDKNIRIWSAGCSSGEEAYSIAITFFELLSNRINDFNIEIIGTDIDDTNLNRARNAEYGIEQLKEAEPEIITKYFNKVDENYIVNDDVKKLVKFEHRDMLNDLKPRNLDIIFCRNVVIYFSKVVKEKLYLDFYNSLKLNGFLVLGKTETLTGPARDKFELIDISERIYKK